LHSLVVELIVDRGDSKAFTTK